MVGGISGTKPWLEKLILWLPKIVPSSFSPEILKKRETILADNMSSKIISLYSMGLSLRDISSHIEEMYDVEISHNTLSVRSFDTLFAFTDTLAIGAMNCLQDHGILVPRKLRLPGSLLPCSQRLSIPNWQRWSNPLVKSVVRLPDYGLRKSVIRDSSQDCCAQSSAQSPSLYRFIIYCNKKATVMAVTVAL